MLRRLLLPCLVCVVGLVSLRASAEPFDPYAQIRPFAVRDTQEARIVLTRARTSLEEGKLGTALADLQYVLDQLQDDYFLDAEASQPASVLWRAAAAEAKATLRDLAPEQRGEYERLVAPRASALLERAMALGDGNLVGEVVRRFGASDAGREAALLLARMGLEAGRFHDAADTARRALQLHPADEALWRVRLDAMAASEDRAGLTELALGDVEGELGTTLVAHRDALLAGLPETEDAAAGIAWPLWGGNATRTRRMDTRAPAPQQLRAVAQTNWRTRVRDQRPSRFMREHPSQNRMREMRPYFRPLFPVASGRTVVVADGTRVRGLDLYSGTERWIFPAPELGRDHTAPFHTTRLGRRGEGRTSIERPFAPTVHEGRILATLEEPYAYSPETLQYIEISNYLPRRRLVCLDLEKGTHLWTAGQADGDRDLRRMSIVCPVVVAEGVVVALTASYEGTHNLWACGFDFETGKRLWERRLATGQQELNLFGIPVKELAGSSIAVHDGVAYAHTGLGFIAALEVRTGAPRWLASYEIQPIEPVEFWYHAPVRLPEAAPNPPRVFGDQLIVAPTDGMHIHGYDLATGKLRWRRPYRRGTRRRTLHPTQVLGVAESRGRNVLLITDSTLRAIALEGPDQGSIVWESLDPEEAIIGQGAIAGGEVLVPTHRNLRRYSLLREGTLVSAVPWPEGAGPGNVLPLEHVLLVAEQRYVQWFIDLEALDTLMAKRHKAHPNDPQVLLEAAELYMGSPEGLPRARTLFEEALAMAKRTDHTGAAAIARQGLFRLALRTGSMLEASPARAVEAYRRGLTYAETPDQRIALRDRIDPLLGGDPAARAKNLEAWIEEAGDLERTFALGPVPVRARLVGLLRLADVREEQDKLQEAAAVLQRVLEEHPEERIGAMSGAERAHVRLAIMIREHGPEVYAEQEKRVAPLYAAAMRSGDADALQTLCEQFPVSRVVPEARLAMARLSIDAGDIGRAVRTLERVLAQEGSTPLSVRALALLARAYRIEGALGAARSVRARLARLPADTPLELRGEDATTLGAFLSTEAKANPQSSSRSGPPGRLAPPLAEVHFEKAGDESRGRALILKVARSEDGTRREPPVAVMVASSEVIAIDLATGKRNWRKDVGSPQRGIYAHGHIILAIRDKLRAFHETTGEETWSYDLGGFTRELVVQDGLIHTVIYDTGSRAGETRVITLDAFRGRELWTRDLGSDNPRRMHVVGNRIALERTRFERDRNVPYLLVLDALSGRVVKERGLPSSVDTPPIQVGGVLIYAVRRRDAATGRSQRILLGVDGRTGDTAWERPAAAHSTGVVTGLAPRGGEVVVLFSNSIVLRMNAKDGAVLGTTQIHIPSVSWMRPFHATRLHVHGGRLVVFPALGSRARKEGVFPAVMAFDLETGKRAWSAPLDRPADILSAHLYPSGRHLASVIAFRDGDEGGVQLQVVNLDTGTVEQTLLPQGLAQGRMAPSAVSGQGTVVVVGPQGASVFRGETAGGLGR